MKQIISRAFLLAVVTSIATSCSHNSNPLVDNEVSVAAKNVTTSDCKEYGNEETRASILKGESLEYSAIKDESGLLYLHLHHVNVYYNCALRRVDCTATLEDGTIKVDERAVLGPLVNCMCPFDVTFDVGPFVPGHYKVQYFLFGNTEKPYAEFELDFSETLSGTVDFPDDFFH